MKDESFYMVYNPKGAAPTMRHATHAQAKAEATRLAEKQPGDTFYVLRSRLAVKAEPPKPSIAVLAAEVAAARKEVQSLDAREDLLRKAHSVACGLRFTANEKLESAQRALLTAAGA